MSERAPHFESITPEDPEVVGAGYSLRESELGRFMGDPEVRVRLAHVDAVLFIKGAISLDTGRAASSITNEELNARLIEVGKEWDPVVARGVRRYLRTVGF